MCVCVCVCVFHMLMVFYFKAEILISKIESIALEYFYYFFLFQDVGVLCGLYWDQFSIILHSS